MDAGRGQRLVVERESAGRWPCDETCSSSTGPSGLYRGTEFILSTRAAITRFTAASTGNSTHSCLASPSHPTLRSLRLFISQISTERRPPYLVHAILDCLAGQREVSNTRGVQPLQSPGWIGAVEASAHSAISRRTSIIWRPSRIVRYILVNIRSGLRCPTRAVPRVFFGPCRTSAAATVTLFAFVPDHRRIQPGNPVAVVSPVVTHPIPDRSDLLGEPRFRGRPIRTDWSGLFVDRRSKLSA